MTYRILTHSHSLPHKAKITIVELGPTPIRLWLKSLATFLLLYRSKNLVYQIVGPIKKAVRGYWTLALKNLVYQLPPTIVHAIKRLVRGCRTLTLKNLVYQLPPTIVHAIKRLVRGYRTLTQQAKGFLFYKLDLTDRSYSLVFGPSQHSFQHVKLNISFCEFSVDHSLVFFKGTNVNKLCNKYKSFDYSFPKVKQFSKAIINVGSPGFFTENNFNLQPDIDPNLDHFTEHGHNYWINTNERKVFLKKNIPKHRVSSAIDLSQPNSTNYAHWLTEILPKLVVLLSTDVFNKEGTIIIEDCQPNFKTDSIIRLLPKDATHNIMIVPNHFKIFTEKLYCVSGTGYVPLMNKKKQSLRNCGAFNPIALRTMREKLVSECNTHNKNKRVFVRRVSQHRNLKNQLELINASKPFGFTEIEPSEMEFFSQVESFFNTDFVVGPVGAAMINCIFCKPGTTVLLLSPRLTDISYQWWTNLFSIFGLSTHIVISKAKSGEVHQDYEIVEDDFRRELGNIIR